MTENELQDELARLKQENADLKKAAPAISLKVSAKGGVSIYGLQRFPVTLYKEQWVKVLDMSDDIREFILSNDAALRSLGED